MEIAAIICQRQRPHLTHKHPHTLTLLTHTYTHICTIGRTLFHGFALCQQNCNKNHRTTGKKRRRKKIIFTFTMTMSLCLHLPATPPVSMPGTLMVCEQCQINREERKRGREGGTKCLVVGGAWGIIGF